MADAPPPKFTLLLVVSEDQFPRIAGVELMTWADAEMVGYESFGLFDRIIATPPQFPDRKGEHHRPEMVEVLIRRLEGGAHVVFLLPPAGEGGLGPRSPFCRAEVLLREVTGARLVDRIDPNAVPLAFDRAAPASLQPYLARHAPDVGVRVPADASGLGPLVPHTVLAGFARLAEDPCVVAGFPGSGMWLALPWRPQAGDKNPLTDVLALLDDAESVRRAHDARVAALLGGVPPGFVPLRRERPTPDSTIGKLLARLEQANGRFVGIGRESHKDVSRLRTRYGVRIETAKEARLRGAKVAKGVTGYRLPPPE